MRYLFIAGAILLGLLIPSSAQQGGALVVATCGTLPQAYAVGSVRQLTINTSGLLCL